MSHLLENSFSTWSMTEQEEFQGSVFSMLQKQCIQNEIAKHAEMKLALDFDPQNPEKFLQEEASLNGKVAILQFLLEKSESVEEEIRHRAENPINHNRV